MRKLLVALALFLFVPIAAMAQNPPVSQSGTVTPGHVPMWTTNGVIQDAGTATNGSLSTLGVTASGNGICQNSGPITAPFQQLCLGVNSSGGTISLAPFGGASAGSLTAIINGNSYQFPFTPPATAVQGPNPTTVGNIGCWANTIGTLQGNCGLNSSLLYSAPNYGINTANTNLWTSDNQEFSNNNGRTVIISTPSTGQQGCISYWDGLHGGAGGGTQKWQLCKQPGQDFVLQDIVGNRADLDVASNGNMKIMANGGGVQIGANVNGTTPTSGAMVSGNAVIGGPAPWIDATSGSNGCAAAVGNPSVGDDTSALQCQLNYIAAHAGTGGNPSASMLFLPCGDYKVSGGGLTVGTHTTIFAPNPTCATIDTVGADITAVTVSGGGGDYNTFYNVSVSCSTSSSAANACVVVTSNTVFNAYNISIQGGKYGLDNRGTDGYIFGGHICGTNTASGACIYEEGGNWYFHLSLDGTAHTSFYGATPTSSNESGCILCDFSNTGEAIHIDDGGANVRQLMVTAGVIGGAVNLVHGKGVYIAGSEFGNAVSVSAGNVTIAGGQSPSSSTVSGGSLFCTGTTNDAVCLGTPTLPGCTGGTGLATGSTDHDGTVNFTSASSCVITFGRTWAHNPFCIVSPGSAASTTEVVTSTTTLSVTFGTANTSMSYHCAGT